MVRFDIELVGMGQTLSHLNGLIIKVPKALEKDTDQIARDYKQGLKDEILAQDLVWHGILLNSIRISKGSKGEFAVFCRDYGVMLDQMAPHIVKVEGKSVLEQWVKENLPDESPKYLKVKPYPWINNGLERGRKKIKKRIANGNVIRLLRKKVI